MIDRIYLKLKDKYDITNNGSSLFLKRGNSTLTLLLDGSDTPLIEVSLDTANPCTMCAETDIRWYPSGEENAILSIENFMKGKLPHLG